MSFIGKLNVDGTETLLLGSTLYGVCETEASNPAKTVNIPGFDTLYENITIHVKFINTNLSTNTTLAVGSTSAKPLMMYGSTQVGQTISTSWEPGSIITLTYDGTNWVMNDHLNSTDIVTNSQTADGLVTRGQGHVVQVWSTDASGNPGWHEPWYWRINTSEALYTYIDDAGWVSDVIVPD